MKWFSVIAIAVLACASSLAFAENKGAANSISAALVDTTGGTNYAALVMSTLGVGSPAALVSAYKPKNNTTNISNTQDYVKNMIAGTSQATATTTKTTSKTSGATTSTSRDNTKICYCGTTKVSCTQSAKETCEKGLASCQSKYTWRGSVPSPVPSATTASDTVTTGATSNAKPTGTATTYPGAPETAEDKAFGILVDESGNARNNSTNASGTKDYILPYITQSK